jgi:hypothetical protein
MFPILMNHLSVVRPRQGRPRSRPECIRGGEAYSSRTIRQHLRSRGIIAVIHGTLSPARTPHTPRQQGRPARRLHEPAGCDTSGASDMSNCIKIPCFNRGAAELVIRAITRKYVASGRTSYALNLAYRSFNS